MMDFDITTQTHTQTTKAIIFKIIYLNGKFDTQTHTNVRHYKY